MNIKWNKINLNLSYLIIKAYHIVEPNKSRQILLQQKETALVNEDILPQNLNGLRQESA